MAYALALSCAVDFPTVGPVILIDTLVYSFSTILVQGSVMNPILGKCDVKQKPELPGLESDITGPRQNCCNRFKLKVRAFDNFYFAPLFIKSQNSIQRRNETETGEFQGDLGYLNQQNVMSDSPNEIIDPFSLNQEIADEDRVKAGEIETQTESDE
jgi:hypothetical protein